jgi:hypothetical protein
MASGHAVEEIVITNRDIPPVCEVCVYGKLKRNEFPTSNRKPVTEVGQMIAAKRRWPHARTMSKR